MEEPDVKKMVFVLIVFTLAASQVFAAEGGYSNYIPGFYGDVALSVAPPDGLSIRNDIYLYSADGGASARAGRVEVSVDISLVYDFLTFLYKPGIEVFGAQYAFGAGLSFGKVDIEGKIQSGGLPVNFEDDNTGIGDVTLIPAILYWNSGNFHFSLAEYIVTPTGEYDKDNIANIGLNYWTFETDFSVTYLNEKTGQDYSLVLGYNYNTENDDTNYQTGQEIHVDFILNQFLSESLAVGINGFYLKQITGDSGAGAVLGDFKSEAAGIGPAIMWMPKRFNGKAAFIAKWINEFDAEYRLEGDHVFVSFAMSF
jgi:hypothetical protein